MSKLKSDKINFENSDYVIQVGNIKEKKSKEALLVEKFQQEFSDAKNDSAKTSLEKAKEEAEKIIEEAQKEADKIVEKAKEEAQKIVSSASEEGNQQAQKIIEKAKENSQKELENLINSSKEDIEKERVETINNGYKEGYEDGHKKLLEELEEKINFFDNFCKTQYQIEQNILKAASKEILDIINAISKKVLFKELNGEIIEKIIKNTITLLENKDNVNIILSEKYAKILYEYQKKSLNNETDFDFSDFKQFENFNIVYSPEYKDDTIIIENFKERFDASINSQMEIIIRDIYEKAQKETLELEEYKKIHEIN